MCLVIVSCSFNYSSQSQTVRCVIVSPRVVLFIQPSIHLSVYSNAIFEWDMMKEYTDPSILIYRQLFSSSKMCRVYFGSLFNCKHRLRFFLSSLLYLCISYVYTLLLSIQAHRLSLSTSSILICLAYLKRTT